MKPAVLLRRHTWSTFLAEGRSSVKPRHIGYARRYLSDAKVITDQTKKNNSPQGEHDPVHVKTASNTDNSPDSAEKNPAKQADPQAPPTRSTGIEPSGPDGEAKDGE